MKDMNIPKLTSADLPLFNGIIADLFPGVETSNVDYTKVSSCVSVLCWAWELSPHARMNF